MLKDGVIVCGSCLL